MSIVAGATVPADLLGRVTHSAALLGLDAWRITVDLLDHCADTTAESQAHIHARYWVATLQFTHATLTRPDLLDVLVLHELLHVANSAQDTAVRRLLDLVKAHAPKDLPLAEELWEHADETVVEALARALAAALPRYAGGTDATPQG